MKTPLPLLASSCSTADAEKDIIETSALRVMLARLAAASADVDIKEAPERASKLTIQMINLTKTIRETESYNRMLRAALKDSPSGGTLEERLEGYAPSPSELKELRAELKAHLESLGPRLFEDDA